MKKNINKKVISSGLFVCLLLSVFSFASAIDCSGEECSGTISLTLGNSAPTVPHVGSVSEVILTGGTTKTIYVVFNASDSNGYLDLDHGTASVTLFKSGETNRTSSVCVAQENTTKQTVFNCSIEMEFYDSAGADWGIDATVDDDAAETAKNDTEVFTVASLDFVTQDVSVITWASVITGTNDNEADNSIIITNGGNNDYTVLNLTGYDATYSGNVINAENFSVDGLTGQSADQTYMVNDTAVDATANADLVGLTTHGASVTEEIFFYVDAPDALLVGEYVQDSSWVIKIA